MARILTNKCKQCRREGRKLFLKSARCFSAKCPIEKKGSVVPGFHGKKRPRKLSEFGIQMREKQKAKRMYGVGERQMRNYFMKAKKGAGSTGEYILTLLETRLDNVIFRGGLVSSRSIARQTVRHGFVLVDGKKLDIPSYQVKKDEVITLSAKALKIPVVKEVIEKKIFPPKWLEKKALVLKVMRLPVRDEIDADIAEQLIVEFYSR